MEFEEKRDVLSHVFKFHVPEAFEDIFRQYDYTTMTWKTEEVWNVQTKFNMLFKKWRFDKNTYLLIKET